MKIGNTVKKVGLKKSKMKNLFTSQFYVNYCIYLYIQFNNTVTLKKLHT